MYPDLTPAQTAVLTHRAQGKTYKETADHLGISPNTVHRHIRDINLRYLAAGLPRPTVIDFHARATEQGLTTDLPSGNAVSNALRDPLREQDPEMRNPITTLRLRAYQLADRSAGPVPTPRLAPIHVPEQLATSPAYKAVTSPENIDRPRAIKYRAGTRPNSPIDTYVWLPSDTEPSTVIRNKRIIAHDPTRPYPHEH